MKHLKKFSTDTDRIAYERGNNYIEPYVSLVSGDSSVHYNKVPPPNYLRFTALEDGSTLQLKKRDDNEGVELTPTTNIEYSYDGFNFITYDYNEIVFSEGETVYLRGSNPDGFSTYNENEDDYTYHYFVAQGLFECHGNIMSLLYGADFETSPNALIIPKNHCYTSIFNGCASLTTAPELPATTLVDGCYAYMFYGCTNLTSAPELPATTLASNCYSYMFRNCASLNYIKAMFTTTPSSTYTQNWVNSVASNGIFVKNSAAQWNVTGVHGIPTGWTVQTASE